LSIPDTNPIAVSNTESSNSKSTGADTKSQSALALSFGSFDFFNYSRKLVNKFALKYYSNGSDNLLTLSFNILTCN